MTRRILTNLRRWLNRHLYMSETVDTLMAEARAREIEARIAALRAEIKLLRRN